MCLMGYPEDYIARAALVSYHRTEHRARGLVLHCAFVVNLFHIDNAFYFSGKSLISFFHPLRHCSSCEIGFILRGCGTWRWTKKDRT